ncbi:MAG: type II secretion system F family protein [Candidatus Aminicenantes bacterium]|nr:type II secretion system F family protein [Candidatus Aminicenantes bacterium]
MPYYNCRLATDEGRVFSKSYFGPSQSDCRHYYENEGLCILSIKRDWRRIQIRLPFEKKIKDKDFIMFNQELVALIKAGYPVLKGIGIIINRIKNEHLKELLMQVEDEVRAGKSLSEAFSPFEEKFGKVYIASLMAGERSGNLDGTLNRYINYAQVIESTKSRIKSALTYPTLLLFFSFILLGILLAFVLPRFAGFYQDFEAELPKVTQMLLSFSVFMRSNVPYIIAFFLLLWIIWSRIKNKSELQILRDRLKIKMPLFRTLRLESSISLFSRTLSILLQGGISLLSSVEIAAQSVPNKYLIFKMRNIGDNIKHGESLSESLEKTEIFTPLALDMIRIGEASANLQGMLKDVADVYDEKIQRWIDNFVNMIEPVIIIFMGLIAALMLLSVYLPIFNIIRVTR